MQIYMVGGAVRDALLGLPVADRDWVVVGATPEELLAHCKAELAYFKVPAEIEIRAELPKGPTGKILRRALRA